MRMDVWMCVCADDASPGNHLRLLEHYQMSWWEKERGKETVRRGDICVRESEPKRERELLLHILTQARSDWDTYPRDVSSAVLSSSLWKNPLTGNPAAAVAKTNHLNSVTHLLRSAEAVTCFQTNQGHSVLLWVKNPAVSCVPFYKSTHSTRDCNTPKRPNSWRDDINLQRNNAFIFMMNLVKLSNNYLKVLKNACTKHQFTHILTQLSKQALWWQGGSECPGGASPSTLLPQAAVVFLLQPSNRWSKQPFANTTESHAIIMIGHSLFCFGSYFPIGLARGSTDCCDCSDFDLLWRSQQEGEENRHLEHQKGIFSEMQRWDEEWCFPLLFFRLMACK